MKIGIDGTVLTLPFNSGTRHYAEQLLTHLAHLDRKNEYIIFTAKECFLPAAKNFRRVNIPHIFPLLKRQLFLPLAVHSERVDVFHYLEPFGALFFNHPRIVTTVHDLNLDLVYANLDSLKYKIKKSYSSLIREGTLHNTHTFITDSLFIKHELQQYLDTRQINSKISVIPLAYHPSFAIKKYPKQRKSYFLCFGDFSPRKNIPQVIEAFSLIKNKLKKNIRLKIITSTEESYQQFRTLVKERNLANSVDIVKNPSLQQLVELYAHAIAFVYPSLYEGFGIPILEAMASGCPVITSNLGATKELAGDGALFVNPFSKNSISAAMNSLIINNNLGKILKNKGKLRMQEYSWQQTALKTLAVYKKINRSGRWKKFASELEE